MPRKGPAQKRGVTPDPIYNNRQVAQLINAILQRGKKSVAEATVYMTFDIIKEKTGSDPIGVYRKALENVRPNLEVKSRRVGGATYQVPIEVSSRRALTLSLRWIVGFSRTRREKRMCERLAGELMDAANSTGTSIKKREDLHKMAEANRAFAHYRW